MIVIHLLIAFLASLIGSICGVGGGVIMKPILDLLGSDSASAIQFFSTCTVLTMSLYSVIHTLHHKNITFDYHRLIPLSIGSAIGGLLGSTLFHILLEQFDNPNELRIIQSILLGISILMALLYTIYRKNIQEHSINHFLSILCIGLGLGLLSSFLGIGGGPINLIVLFYFFSMSTKEAAISSLFIILFGQITSLLSFFLSGIPEMDVRVLGTMMIGGLLGGIVGRKINKKIDEGIVNQLFISLMIVIIGICIFNIFK